ncbi:substrate-binding domain-containing protein, partial [Klebsiella pneumoniae]|uniref:substrate-binding domain-containing protein n=1 Tax=Klebsiella pneumoniae TaxID=573 RepID=UPI002174E919
EALHPKTKIIAEYKPEGECFKDLQKDSTRMIIVTRPLNREEEKWYKEYIHFYPSMGKVAYDAIAVVVNKQSADTVLYRASLRSIMDGSSGGTKKVIFDGVSGSSVLRYVQDSILRGKSFDTSRVYGVNGSEEVLRRVE